MWLKLSCVVKLVVWTGFYVLKETNSTTERNHQEHQRSSKEENMNKDQDNFLSFILLFKTIALTLIKELVP